MLLMAFFAVASLTSCSSDDDEPKDVVKEIRMLVSAETGVTYAWGDDKQEYPIECMLVKTDGDSGDWQPLEFNRIEGFTYERGHEYYLSVKRTILANPPADGSDRTYSLVRVLEDRLVAEPEVPLDKGNPNWAKFNTVPYQAYYSYVLSPLTDKIRFVRNELHGPMFKNVIPENEFTHITQSMKSGEELHYALILANVQKKGVQKVEFTVKKQ